MTVPLVSLWLHVIGVVVWIGGLMYQSHVQAPAARHGDARGFAAAGRRARPITWTAIALVALSGFYNVTRLGSLERVMETGAGLMLAGKFMLVLAAVALAGQRDFAYLARLERDLQAGADPLPALGAIAWIDRTVLALALIIIYLGLAVSRSAH